MSACAQLHPCASATAERSGKRWQQPTQARLSLPQQTLAAKRSSINSCSSCRSRSSSSSSSKYRAPTKPDGRCCAPSRAHTDVSAAPAATHSVAAAAACAAAAGATAAEDVDGDAVGATAQAGTVRAGAAGTCVCLRCGSEYSTADNSPTACHYHGHMTGDKGLLSYAPPHQGVDGEWSEESGVIVYVWNDEGKRPNTGSKNWKRRWTCCALYGENAPPCRRGWHVSYDDGASRF